MDALVASFYKAIKMEINGISGCYRSYLVSLSFCCLSSMKNIENILLNMQEVTWYFKKKLADQRTCLCPPLTNTIKMGVTPNVEINFIEGPNGLAKQPLGVTPQYW